MVGARSSGNIQRLHQMSNEQISPPSLVCEQNSSHLHSLCVGFLFNCVLPWEFIYVKLRNFIF